MMTPSQQEIAPSSDEGEESVGKSEEKEEAATDSKSSGQDTQATGSSADPATIDEHLKQLRMMIAPISSEPASSGLGSTTPSEAGPDEIEKAKAALRSIAASDFKDAYTSSQLLPLKKALNVLVKTKALPDTIAQSFQDFHQDLPRLRRDFTRATEDFHSSDQKLTELSTLQAGLQVYLPKLDQIQEQEEVSTKKKAELSGLILDKQNQIVGLESQITVLKDEIAETQKQLQVVNDAEEILQKDKTELFLLTNDSNLKLQELHGQKNALEALRGKAEEELLDINTIWEGFQKQVAENL